MEIVRKKSTHAYCVGTHLSILRVPNTQNSRFADLWLRMLKIFKSSIFYNYFKMMVDYWLTDPTSLAGLSEKKYALLNSLTLFKFIGLSPIFST
jgi:hypothetical protein